MAVVKKISELTPKGSNLASNDLLIVGVDNGVDYDLKSVTGAELLSTAVSQTITNGVTTSAPSQNAVYDALDLKVDKLAGSRLITSAESTILGNTSGTNSGDETVTTIKSKLGITTLSGSNTGDQNLQQVTDLGTDTNKSITSTGALYRGTLSNATIQSSTLLGGVYTSIDADGKVQVNTTGNGVGLLKSSNLVNNVTLEFPNKSVGNYTIATTSDLTSKVDSNTSITGATKTKITYDSKGLVTSGTDATTSDIADSTNKRYVTDAQLTVLGNTSGTNTGDQIISDATLTTSDITTNDVSTTKHGFVPKAPNNTTQYLRGDGTWATPSAGGLTYFTEAQSTASPNATVNVDSLTAIASTTNADFAIVPKGTGAILAQVPDGTATGGNKRGVNSVDLQTFRSQAIEVASGNYSAIVSGQYNKSTGVNSFIGAGYSNNTSGSYSAGFGFGNTASGSGSFAGGSSSTASNTTDFAFGSSCVISAGGYYGNVSMGYQNTISAGLASTVFGNGNIISNFHQFAAGNNHRLTSGNGSASLGTSTMDNGFPRLMYGSDGWVRGDSQSSKSILNGRTTNATPTVLSVGRIGETVGGQITLQNNNSIRFKGTIIARQSGSTNTAAWDIDGIIQRGTSAATTTLLIGNVNVVQNTPAWGTPTLAANTTLGCLTVTVTGASATNIQWTCAIDTTEVIYA
jgi:hypothetical protein